MKRKEEEEEEGMMEGERDYDYMREKWYFQVNLEKWDCFLTLKHAAFVLV